MTGRNFDFPPFHLELPGWINRFLQENPQQFSTVEERMQWVTALAQRNVAEGTGGPFAAGIFRLDTHQLLAPGVNLVQSSWSSIPHAEVVAILIGQQILKSYDLGAKGLPTHELVTSCEPCAMCLGAVLWAGIRQLTCGARGSDAVSIGFDEGPKPDNWIAALETRGISVKIDIERAQAVNVLKDYVRRSGTIYNGRQGSPP